MNIETKTHPETGPEDDPYAEIIQGALASARNRRDTPLDSGYGSEYEPSASRVIRLVHLPYGGEPDRRVEVVRPQPSQDMREFNNRPA